MGCKDDDTCDQPATKGDIEGIAGRQANIFSAQLVLVSMVGFTMLVLYGLERRL